MLTRGDQTVLVASTTSLPPSLSVRELAVMLSVDGQLKDRVRIANNAVAFLGDPEFDFGQANTTFQRLHELKLVMHFDDTWTITPRGVRAMKLSRQYVAKIDTALRALG